MIKPRRLLAGAALAATCALVASACDSSPVAVKVNAEQIKQTRVNATLREYAGNTAFVDAFQSQTGAPSIQGASSGSYNSEFVAVVLNDLIQSTALHQYLAAHDMLPSARQVAAARAYESATQGSDTWLGFSSDFRDQTAEQIADEAQFVQPSLSAAQVRQKVDANAGHLFTLVCVRQVGFTVTDADGQPNFSASLERAREATSGGRSLEGGAVTCYSPPRLEDQGNPFYNTVVGARLGHPTAPERTKFGYQVLQVTDRNQLPVDEGMRKVVSLITQQQDGDPSPARLQQVISSARIWLNPQYGTWDAQRGVTPTSVKTAASAT